MTAKRWAQIRELFDAAIEKPAADREAFVHEACTGDAELCEETLAMLRNNSEGGEAEGLLDLTLLGRQWIRPVILAQTLIAGQVLAGRYRVVRPIGAGGMGEVYEAEDLELGARIALKTLRLADETGLARFKREIQLAQTVTHPNVCRIFDLHRHHDRESGSVVTFLTMELVDGETLTEYLARLGRLNPRDALPIASQIAAALAAAHEKRVVHRDLKPGNVILNGGSAVVTDFGLAYPMTLSTESTVTVVGTPAYMAPEQFEGKPVTAETDIYAFGALLYEMVVGRRPFSGDSPIALALEKIRKEPPRAADSVPDLPPTWSSVIQRCLDPKPERRFNDIRIVLRKLQESVDRPPFIALSRAQKRVLAVSALLAGMVGLSAWHYTQSVHSPSSEASRLYRLGAHAQQLGLPWKATQLYERALENDGSFIAARAALAEAWMDLDQPQRAKRELERVAQSRPRWQRSADYESLLEQAAQTQLQGNLTGAALLHQHAVRVAPKTELPDLLASEGMARIRARDISGALAAYRLIPPDSRCHCISMLAEPVLTYRTDPIPARRLFDAAVNCFEATGDLDGVARSWYEISRSFGRSEITFVGEIPLRRSVTIAQTMGNVEQEIITTQLLSEVLLDLGDEEAAGVAFSRAIQIADRSSLPFIAARLLNDRAQYYFDRGDFLQSDNVGGLALQLSRSAGMPWTHTRGLLRTARLRLQMKLPTAALYCLADAHEQLREFPDAALLAETEELTDTALQTRARPQDKVYKRQRQ